MKMVNLLSIPGYIGEHIFTDRKHKVAKYVCIQEKCFMIKLAYRILQLLLIVLIDMPSLSGVSDMDYPLQGPGLLSVPNLPELSAVRRVPLPPELVEQFSRILLVIQETLNCLQMDSGVSIRRIAKHVKLIAFVLS